MEKYLIVSADDFGLSAEINEGIIDSFKNGCVTSASMITTEDNFHDAIEKIRANPLLDIGIHLNIFRGKAKNSLLSLFLKRLFDKQRLRKKIYVEFENQIKKAIDQKIIISHLDTEKHLHIFPFILEIVLDLAQKYNIKSVRFPFEKMVFKKISPRQLLKIFFSYLFYKKCYSLFDQSGIIHPDFFYGVSLSNRFSVDNLKRFVDNLKPGISELSCHPSYRTQYISSFIDSSNRDEERETLTSPELLSHIKERDIVLVNYGVFNTQN